VVGELGMNNALIGYTGFVGGNILEQNDFDQLYNSKNFQEMRNKNFDEVVCAGVSAVKWVANKEPDVDRNNIKQLEDVLSSISADRFVLISTIDVYPDTYGKDESFDCSLVENDSYGAHRLEFEKFCMESFSNCFIIRLPGLFGNGLKKNVIYDLVNHNCLEMINPASSFQYYDLKNIWSDIKKAISSELHLVNLFTEPVKTQTIIDRFFSDEKFDDLASSPAPEAHYALKSIYAAQWGGENGYIYSESQVLAQLDDFIKRLRET